MRKRQTTMTRGLLRSGAVRKLAAVLPLLLAMAGFVQAQVTNNPVDWVGGDVFAGSLSPTSGATYQVWHNSPDLTTGKPNYGTSPEQILHDGSGGTAAGCGFDLAYRFFGTNVTNSLVDRYSIANAHPIVEPINSGRIPPAPPSATSVALDSGANLFIGYAGGVTNGIGTIEQWAKDTSIGGTGKYTNFVTSFSVPVDNSGPGWIDLASDGHTIFYTSQGRKIYKFDTTTQTAVVWADLSTLNGNLKKGTLFAIKILPLSGDGSEQVLVADQGNVKLVKASGGVITGVTAFSFGSLSNLQALSLDLFTNTAGQMGLSPTTFWVGDATAASKNLLRFNMSTNTTEVTLSTGAGVGGVCVDGAFNAGQFAFQPNLTSPNTAPNFQTQIFSLTPASNTLSFNSPFTGETLTATLRNLTKPVNITLRDSVVSPSVGMSDPTVYFLNPGSPAGTTIAGNLPCDHTLTDLALYPGTLCEVLSFEANPNSGFSSPDMIINTSQSEDTPNLMVLSNEADNVTTGTVKYPTTSKNCVLTINQQPIAGGFLTPTYQICSFLPADGSVLSKSAGSSTITFTLNVTLFGQCSNSGNQGTPTNLKPLLMIEQIQNDGSAPANIQVIIAGKSGGPPVMTLSGNTYQLQVKTTDMTAGFQYLATVIDLSGNITSTSSYFTLTK